MQDNTENKVKRLVTTFGKIVQKHRKEQNKTIYKISAEIAMPKASWRELENGVADFRFSSLWKVAEGLDIPPETLIAELRKELGDDFSISGLK